MTTKEPCPKCGSRDNLARWEDGHAKCFSSGCGYWEPSPSSPPKGVKKLPGKLIETLSYTPLTKRHLTEESCRKWGYGLGTFKGETVQVACYRDAAGAVVAQKVRTKDKDFCVLGDASKMGLYGAHLWHPKPNLKVVLTEGEIDAISVSQIQGHKWPVVSIPNGAQGATKAVRDALEWLEQFDQVIFMFDMDEPGRKAASDCAALLSPGKAFVAELPLKDANECLVAGKADVVIQAVFNARPYRPDGILAGTDIDLKDLQKAPAVGFTTPYPELDALTRGIRRRELTLLTAGTGVGKSTLAREIAYHLAVTHKLKVGNVFLEESWQKTVQGYVAIHHNVPLGDLREKPDLLSPSQYKEAVEAIKGNMWFYDHFGSLESDALLGKLNYLALGLQVDFIVLDHISLVISGMTSSSEGERKDIDILMTRLRSLVERSGVGVIAITHLKQPEGKPHEEGGRVTLSDLRGSASLKQLPDTIIALERDQQGEDPNYAKVRVLKNREFGALGLAGGVRYDLKTGRLESAGDPAFAGDSAGVY